MNWAGGGVAEGNKLFLPNLLDSLDPSFIVILKAERLSVMFEEH